jgi:hypothetical protein
MEGWSRSRTEARTCLPIDEAAERLARKDERSTQDAWCELHPRNALPDARVDAGYKNRPVEGGVPLDILLDEGVSMGLRRDFPISP